MAWMAPLAARGPGRSGVNAGELGTMPGDRSADQTIGWPIITAGPACRVRPDKKTPTLADSEQRPFAAPGGGGKGEAAAAAAAARTWFGSCTGLAGAAGAAAAREERGQGAVAVWWGHGSWAA